MKTNFIKFLVLFCLLSASVSALNVDGRCCHFNYCICPDGYLESLSDADTTAETSEQLSSSGLSINKFISKYIPVISAFYVPIKDYQALEDRVFMLEARLNMLDEGYLFLVPEHEYLVLLRAASLKQSHYNTSKVNINGYKCMSEMCIK